MNTYVCGRVHAPVTEIKQTKKVYNLSCRVHQWHFLPQRTSTHEIYTVESIAGMHRYEVVVICDMFSH